MNDTQTTPDANPATMAEVPSTGDIVELRGHLMATLRSLRDKTEPMEPDRARVISQTAGAVIDSIRAETEFLRVIGGEKGTGFITDGAPALPAPTAGAAAAGTHKPDPIGNVTRHLLR